MANRARRNNPRPPARRGGAVFRRSLRLPPLVNGYRAEISSPPSGSSFSDRTPQITVIGTDVALAPVDIQIEWRRQQAVQQPGGSWLPAPIHLVQINDAVSGTPQFTEPPVDLDYGTWWYRARAGNAGTNIWGDWSPQAWLDVRRVLGSWTQYIDINVGVEAPPLAGAVAYIEMNIGLSEEQSQPTAAAYTEMNVGIEDLAMQVAIYTDLNIGPALSPYRTAIYTAIYTDLNTVTDETPIPHIWWIRPEQGREGFVFNIYGQGFGAFQNEYDGVVRLGNLVCAIARWETVPAALRSAVVRVTGTPRITSSTTALPTVLLNTATSRVFAVGDIIEYDMLWEVPSGSRLDIFPTFAVSGSTSPIGLGSALLNDDTGDAWVSAQPEAQGAWHHRRFVIPPGHYLVGRTGSNFGIAWYGFDAAAPVRTASIRSFVVRSADETPVLWVTGDDQESGPLLTYIANTGTLTSTEYDQEGHVIEHGAGLDPDLITPEHGWIVAIVPNGAVSAGVRVVLEDD